MMFIKNNIIKNEIKKVDEFFSNYIMDVNYDETTDTYIVKYRGIEDLYGTGKTFKKAEENLLAERVYWFNHNHKRIKEENKKLREERNKLKGEYNKKD